MPTSPYRVAISIDGPYRERVRSRSLAALARRSLASEYVPGPLALSVVITNDATVRSLNHRFRGEDTPTDVLSFGLDDDAGFVSGQGISQLGEIVISFPTARRQAGEARHDIDDELAHLLVHGVLHLLGYDHKRPRDAKAMHTREDALLGRTAH